jgi:UDP-N-acetylmuramoylalanine--D-glutamate ligase
VVIIGAARQGLALARYLVLHGVHVVINDRRPADEMGTALASLSDLPQNAVEWVFGGHPLEVLDNADVLCPSGGVSLQMPLVQEARRRGVTLSNDSQIFLEAAPCRVIGITGSAGKTTTTTLVGRMAQAALGSTKNSSENSRGSAFLGVRSEASHTQKSDITNFRTDTKVWVGGNIGAPLVAAVDQMKPDDLAVMELSSFQLEIMTCSPQIAAVLNITPNHLDRHANMDEYTTAKKHILEFQAADDVAVLGRDDPGAWKLTESIHGRLVSFGLQAPSPVKKGTYVWENQLYWQDGAIRTCLMPSSDILLRGEHNLLNVLAACAIAAAAGLPVEAMRAGVQGFMGVPHRLELVREWNGARWYNDSIATAPERSIAAIRSFDEPLVLLAGGRDKNLPWEDFAALVCQRVDHLILFGEAAGKIGQAVEQAKSAERQRPFSLKRCTGLREAVQEAAQVARAQDVVLFSPGGTSFDEFRDFEERGEAFRQWVTSLK